MADIGSLIGDIEKIAEIEKCLACQCLADTLQELNAVLKKQSASSEIRERLARIQEKATVTHNCLGCDPCLPVPVSNALAEMAGNAPVSVCGPACKPMLTLSPAWERAGVRGKPSWPAEQGEYIAGVETSPVAITALGSDDLPALISERVGQNNFAIMGKTHTENIGIEKIVKNIISNPHIRFLILCGKDTRGHMAGQSLFLLKYNGVDQDKKIIGSKGQRPALKNLDLSEIEHFRKQVHIINLIGTDDAELIAQQTLYCSIARRKTPASSRRRPQSKKFRTGKPGSRPGLFSIPRGSSSSIRRRKRAGFILSITGPTERWMK